MIFEVREAIEISGLMMGQETEAREGGYPEDRKGQADQIDTAEPEM